MARIAHNSDLPGTVRCGDRSLNAIGPRCIACIACDERKCEGASKLPPLVVGVGAPAATAAGVLIGPLGARGNGLNNLHRGFRCRSAASARAPAGQRPDNKGVPLAAPPTAVLPGLNARRERCILLPLGASWMPPGKGNDAA